MKGGLLSSWSRRDNLAGPNGCFQEDRSPQGMLMWGGWLAARPGDCWKETGEVWVLLGECWLFREGTRDRVNTQLRSGLPVHAQLQGRVLGQARRVCAHGVSCLLGCGL